MSGWMVLIAAVVLANVVYLVVTLLMARVMGLTPPQATLGLFWRPLHMTLGGTELHVGPLLFGASVSFNTVNGEVMSSWQLARPVTRAILAVSGFALIVLAAWALAGDLALQAVKDVLHSYFTLPLSFMTPLDLGAHVSGLASQHGPFAALATVMAATAAINFIPLPPLAGFTLVDEVVKTVTGKGVPHALSLGLLRIHLAWALVLAVTLLVRHALA